jgi:predicted permease
MGWLQSIGCYAWEKVSGLWNSCTSSATFGLATIIGVIKTNIDSSIRLVLKVVVIGISLYAVVLLYQSFRSSFDKFVERITSKDTSRAAILASFSAFVIFVFVFLRVTNPIIGTFQSASTAVITGFEGENMKAAGFFDATKQLLQITY